MNSDPLLSRSLNFSRSLRFLRSVVNFSKLGKFGVLQLLLRDWLWISHWMVRKIVLCRVCFAYSLLLLVVIVFPLLSC